MLILAPRVQMHMCCIFVHILRTLAHLCICVSKLDMRLVCMSTPSSLVTSVTSEYKDYLLLLLMNKCVTVKTYLELQHVVGDG